MLSGILDLRDYFAGQALLRIVAVEGSYQKVAEKSYRLADAMLKEREEPSGKQSVLSKSSPFARRCNFSGRVRKALYRLNITTVDELTDVTSDALLGCRNFGLTTLQEVRSKLAKQGLYLKGEKDFPPPIIKE